MPGDASLLYSQGEPDALGRFVAVNACGHLPNVSPGFWTPPRSCLYHALGGASSKGSGLTDSYWCAGIPIFSVSQKLTRPMPTKDGGTMRTIRDAREYMLALPERRALRQQWQVATELILDQANIPALSRQIEVALLYEAKLDIAAMEASP